MEKSIKNAFENRRSFYAISKEKILSDEQIIELIQHAVKFSPTAYNAQGARVLILLDKEHDKFWDLTKETLKPLVEPEKFANTEQKINGFKNGYGTVLFFEDRDTITNLQKTYPLYEQKFPVYSQHSAGMLQLTVWTLLESEGYGASLQHYNPLIDEKVKQTWNIPDSWELVAQMPFGKPTANPDAKTFLPIEDRVKVAK